MPKCCLVRMLQMKCRSSYLKLEEKSFYKAFDNLAGMCERNNEKRTSVVFDCLLVEEKKTQELMDKRKRVKNITSVCVTKRLFGGRLFEPRTKLLLEKSSGLISTKTKRFCSSGNVTDVTAKYFTFVSSRISKLFCLHLPPRHSPVFANSIQ